MIIFRDTNQEVVDALLEFGIDARCEDIFAEPGVIVSPANSFGFMDGGVDICINDKLDCEQHVKDALAHHGNPGPGFAVEVPVSHPDFYLIVAPTMWAPTYHRDTINPYLAMRAAIRCYQREGFPSRRKPLVFTGMGTGTGDLHPATFAFQAVRAIEDDNYVPKNTHELTQYYQLLRHTPTF